MFRDTIKIRPVVYTILRTLSLTESCYTMKITFVISNYSDTSANEDNSFRNHIR